MDPSAIVKILVAIKDTIKLIKAQKHAYKHVVKAAEDLDKKINIFSNTLEEAKRYEGQPIFGHLQLFGDTLVSKKDKIDTFLAREANAMTEKPPSRWQFYKHHKVKRAFSASNLIKLFNETSSSIDHALEQLLLVLQVTDRLFQVGAHRFQDLMTPAAFEFWKRICQDDLTSQGPLWSYFISLYRPYHPESTAWDDDIVARIKAIACVDGEEMTIGGYISLTNTCGFPLDPTKLPSMLDSSVCVSTSTRMEITKAINDLIAEFATDAMRRHLTTLHIWYDGHKTNDKTRQERANAWANEYRESRKKSEDTWNEQDKLLDKVDMARRTLFYYYHRYSAIFEVGQVSKALFKKLDFPGKNRMKDFVNLVMPLDRANYAVVLEKDEHAWDKDESKIPEVYKFVKRYIKSLEAEKEKEKAASNDISATSPIDHTAIATSSSPTNGHGGLKLQNNSPSRSSSEVEVDLLGIASGDQCAFDPF